MTDVIAYLTAELARYYVGQNATITVTFAADDECYTALITRPACDDLVIHAGIGSDDDAFVFDHDGSTYLTVPLMNDAA